MTAPAFQPFGSPGCTLPGCGTTATATVDGIAGRRCADHPPTFQPEHAATLAAAGHTATALAYVRTPLARARCWCGRPASGSCGCCCAEHDDTPTGGAA